MSKLEQRLMAKVDKTPGGCWEFTGNIYRGYGRIKIDYKNYPAHRLAAALYLGLDISDSSIMVCHHCDNRKCVNPEHLYLGDHASNTRDAVERARLPRGEDVHNSKLTWNDVRLIRQLYKQPFWSHRKLAAEFNVSRNCIREILKGNVWKEE